MTTTHEQVIADAVRKIAENDPGYAWVLTHTVNKLRRGFWPKDYVAFFYQNFAKFSNATLLEDAYCFINLHYMVYAGRLWFCDLDVGEGPFADRCAADNLAVLNRVLVENGVILADGDGDPCNAVHFNVSLNRPFAEFDGTIAPKGNLLFTRYFGAAGTQSVEVVDLGDIALEIGYTKASRTFLHMQTDGCLARWPYESNTIRIFYDSQIGRANTRRSIT